jgi:hypothetical protein
MRANQPLELVEAWQPDVPGITEVFHATFVSHRYPPHSHDSWAVIIVDRGAISYDLAHHHRSADTATVSVLPPQVMHDGLAGYPPADVAAAVGFYDQAHLTRHFRRHTAVTPGQYARART